MKWGGEGRAELRQLVVSRTGTLLDALHALERGAEGIALVHDGDGGVVGVITDGDIRRALIGGATLDSCCLESIMSRDFAFASVETGRAEVLDLMRARDIGQLPVLDEDKRFVGLHTVGRMIAPVDRPNRAVILAGGRGSRLGPLTERIPKPMLRVAGRPILERLVLHLMGHGVKHIYLAVNYLAHVIEEHFGDGSRFGCEIRYLRESMPLGTGGPLSLLPGPMADPVVVVNGDLVTQCDVGRLIDFHDTGACFATFGMRPYSLDIPYGVATVDSDRLVALREKPTERLLINAGIYVLSPEAVAMVPPDTDYPITALFNRCIEEGRTVGAHLVEDEWLDVGHADHLRQARGEH